MSGGGATPVPAASGAPIPASGFTASVVDASRLELPPGRVVVLEAQVMGRTADGTVKLLTRHGPIEIRTAAPLQPGTTAMIEITRGAGDQLTLRVIPVLSPRSLLSLLDAFQGSGPGSAAPQSPSAPRVGAGAPAAAPGAGLERSDGVATGGARATAVVLPPPRADAQAGDAATVPLEQPDQPQPATRAMSGAATGRAMPTAIDASGARAGMPVPSGSPSTTSDARAAPALSARPAPASMEAPSAMRIDPPPATTPQQRATATPAAGGDRIVVAGTSAPRTDGAAAPQASQQAAAARPTTAATSPQATTPAPGAPATAGTGAAARLGSTAATGTALAPQPGATAVGMAASAQAAARGALLAPGSTVELRIDMASIQARRLAAPSTAAPASATATQQGTATTAGTQPAQGAPPTNATTRMLPLAATVAGALPQGRLILDTPLGRLAVAVPPDLAHALPGEKLELAYLPDTIRNAARPPGGEAPMGEQSRRWSDARNVATALASVPDPALRAAAERLLPAPGPRLAQQMMAFIASADGALAQWLGEEATRGLERHGLGELVQRGGAQQQQDQGARQADGAWRSFTMPFLHEGAIRPIQVRARRRREQRGGRSREQSRFVVDCLHDDLGEIQIDGLMTTAEEERRLDVILRSHGALEADDRVAILDLFRDACGAMGLAGDLAFQVLERFPPIAGTEPGRRDVVA